MKRKKGFTLVEIAVVVVTIGILASIAFPRYFKAIEKTKAPEAYTVLGNIRKHFQVTQYGDPCFSNPACSSWNPEIAAASNADWEYIGVDNPNARAAGYFAYDIWSSAYSSTNAPVNAARTVAIAFKRINRFPYSATFDSAKYVYMDLNTGETFSSPDYN